MSFKFYAPVKVRFNDTDKQGHVYFGKYYEFFDVGLEEYMTEIGYDYLLMLEDNTDFIYVESHCNYKSAAKWPEVLHVYTRIGHVGHRSLRFDFEIHAQIDQRLVATGHIVAVTADRKTFTPHPVPDRFKQAIAAYEDSL